MLLLVSASRRARARLCSAPLLLKLEHVDPTFDVRQVEPFTLHRDDSCGIDDLTFRVAHPGPFQLGEKHVLGRSERQPETFNLVSFSAFKLRGAEITILLNDQVDFQTACNACRALR